MKILKISDDSQQKCVIAALIAHRAGTIRTMDELPASEVKLRAMFQAEIDNINVTFDTINRQLNTRY